jgi:hypothetical protein
LLAKMNGADDGAAWPALQGHHSPYLMQAGLVLGVPEVAGIPRIDQPGVHQLLSD